MPSTKIGTVAIAAVMILLTACAGLGGGQPQWLSGPGERYPAPRYLVATGSADTPEKAKDRALANLAKIFEVRIDESSYDESRAWSKTVDGERQRGHGQLAVRYLDTYTTKLLEGADVVETWHDRQSGLHYALAVQPRAPLARRLSADIRKNDRYTRSALERARAADSPFQSARLLYQARMAQFHREALQRDLRIVDSTGAGIPPQWTVAQLDSEIDRQMQRLTVAADVLHDPVGDLAQYLKAGIAAAGMTAGQGNAGYRLQGYLEVEDRGRRDGWYWYRGALEVTLRGEGDDRVLTVERWPLKAAGATPEQARTRLRDQIQQRLTLELKPALLGVTKKPEPGH